MADTDFVTEAQVNALVTALINASSQRVQSADVADVVEITQAAYDGLGAGRPADRLYVITS